LSRLSSSHCVVGDLCTASPMHRSWSPVDRHCRRSCLFMTLIKALLLFKLSSGYLTVYKHISQLWRSALPLQKFVRHHIVCTCVQVNVTISLVFEPCHLQCHAICMLEEPDLLIQAVPIQPQSCPDCGLFAFSRCCDAVVQTHHCCFWGDSDRAVDASHCISAKTYTILTHSHQQGAKSVCAFREALPSHCTSSDVVHV
jgi:hypothetical protein